MAANQIEKLEYEINMLKNTIAYFYDKKFSGGLSDKEYEIYNTTKEILKRKQKSLEDRKKIFDSTNSITSYTYTI